MSSLDLERLMADLIPKLTPTKRRELRYLVRGLRTRKEIGGIPSVSAALVARAPALVGAHLWRACVEKQRREPEPRPWRTVGPSVREPQWPTRAWSRRKARCSLFLGELEGAPPGRGRPERPARALDPSVASQRRSREARALAAAALRRARRG